MKRPTKKPASKAWWNMTTQELREATRRFDSADYHPLSLRKTAEDQKMHKRARRGRPRIGQGAQRIQLTMERNLLGRVDAEAASRGMTRAQFLARAAEHELATAS